MVSIILSAARRCMLRQQARGLPMMRMASSGEGQQKVKKLQYVNVYACPGVVRTEKVVTNPNISYAELCDIQRKFGELNMIGRILAEAWENQKLEENIKIREPMAETIMNYFEFQEPRTPKEAIAATKMAYNLLRKEHQGKNSLPAWKDITMDERAMEYIMDDYGEGGMAASMFSPPVSAEEVLASYRLYVTYCTIHDELCDIDSMGSEHVRNLMLLARRCPPIEAIPESPASIYSVCSIIFPE